VNTQSNVASLAESHPEKRARLKKTTIFRALAGIVLTASYAMTGFSCLAFASDRQVQNPSAPQNWPVQECTDTTGPGSLRYIAVHAQTGDTIDFSQLPSICGTRDSTITLAAGEIVLHQASICLIGPLPEDGTVTLSGGGTSRVLRHHGYSPYAGTLSLHNLKLADGYVQDADGGCILSDASAELVQSSVVGCVAISETQSVSGGAIAALNGKVTLTQSTITGNTVQSATGNANGGGVASHLVQAKYSTFENNHAAGPFARGGGVWTGGFGVAYSTFAGNDSEDFGGGAYCASNLPTVIRNSTFSGNHASYSGGALLARPDNLRVYNSTIANNSIDNGHGGGVYVSATSARFESTIISNNTSGGGPEGSDLYVASGTLTGADNAIMESTATPAGFITVSEDPKLAALAWIGGFTRTRALLPGSPAIGVGNNSGNFPTDQRGATFPRSTGPASKTDIGAIQFDARIFVSDMDQFFF
jgi:hypothetical protein